MTRGKKIDLKKRLTILKVFSISIFLVLLILGCSETDSTGKKSFVIADSKSYEASLFRANCAICHGNEAYGKMVDGKPVPALRFGDAATKSEEEIYQQIAHGKLPMPSFQNQLTEQEMRNMARFVMRDLQGRKVGK